MKTRVGFVSNSSSSSFVVITNLLHFPTFDNFSSRCCNDIEKRYAMTVYNDLSRNYEEDFPIYSNLSLSSRKKKFYKLFFVNNDEADALYCDTIFYLQRQLNKNLNPSKFYNFEQFFNYLLAFFGPKSKIVLEKMKEDLERFFNNCKQDEDYFISRDCEIFNMIEHYCFSLDRDDVPLLRRYSYYRNIFSRLFYKYRFKELMNDIDFSYSWFTVLEYGDDNTEGSYIEHDLFQNLNLKYYRISHH